MIRLTRTIIQNLAADEIVFQRGLTYFKEKRVIHAAYSKNKNIYTFTVKGNQTYRVTVEETGEMDFEITCNCPARYVQKGSCKHAVASLLYLQQYKEQAERKSTSSLNGDSREKKIIRYFMDAGEPRYENEVYHVEPCIEVPGLLRSDSDPVYLSLRVGNTKMYRVQLLKRFLADFREKKSIILGKEFCYLPSECCFDSASERFIKELLSYMDVLEVLDGKNSTRLFQKSNIVINRRLLLKLIGISKGIPLTLNLSGAEIENVRFKEGNPPIEYDFFMQKDSLTMNYKEQEKIVPIISDGSLLLRDTMLYLPDERFMKTYLPFFSTLGEEKDPLVFEEENKTEFLEHVLPVIHETLRIEIPEEVKDRYLSLPFSAKLYLDLFHSAIRLTVNYVYDKHEFNSFDAPVIPGGYILVRDREKEEELEAIVQDYGFEPHNGFYLLKNEDRIHQLITEGISVLSEYGTLYSSDDFNRIRHTKKGTLRMGISLSPGEDLLQVQFSYDMISGEELRSVFYSYRQKKKYHRLNDGSFIDLEEETIKKAAAMLESMNLTYRDFDKNGLLKVSKSHGAYLDSLPKELGFEVIKEHSFDEFLKRLFSPEEQDCRIPDAITIELREYQKTGVSWMRMLCDNHLGGILADDMGLGKTLQAITYMASVLAEEHFEEVPFLVVCPTSLVYNWLDEVRAYAPGIRALIIQGTPEERQELLKNTKGYDICITSYPLIRRDIELYKKKCFHTVFIDEAQFIKNAMTGNARSVKELRSKVRFALTGTPVENSLSELWSIFDFILPGYLFSYSRFFKYFERPTANGDEERLHRLNKRVKPFLMRRMKKDVLTELPDKIETKYVTELSGEQKMLYLSYAEQARNELADEILRVGVEKSRMQILAALTRLRQICCHPGMFLENYDGGSEKMSLCMQLLDNLRKSGNRVLVFSQFTGMLDLLQEALKESEFSYFYLNGSTKSADRKDMVKRFNGGEGEVFLISLKAGGTGLNLTGADTVIHFDPWWNPAVEDQASDRVYRIGQTKSVHIIKLLTKGTIEEKIFRLQQKKQDLFHSVIEVGETFLNKLTQEEITELFADPDA